MRKTKAKKKPLERKNYATPGEPMTQEEFASFVREAEEGPFYPLENLKKETLSVWKKKYGK